MCLRFALLLLTAALISRPPLAAQELPSSAQACTEADPSGNLWLKFPTIPGKLYVVEGSNSVDADTYHPLSGGVFYGDGSVKSFFIRPAPPSSASTPPPTYDDKPLHPSTWLITLAPSTQPGNNLTMLVTRQKEAPETSWTILTTQPIQRPFHLLGFNPTVTHIIQETPDFRWWLSLNFAISQDNLDLTGIPGPESLIGADAEEWAVLDANKLNAMGFLQIPSDDTPPTPRPEGDSIFFRVRIVEGDSNGNGLPDYWELANDFNPYGQGTEAADPYADPDNDGLDNLTELDLGTDPNLADTDGDGFNDGLEKSEESNPLDPKSRPIVIHYVRRSGESNQYYTSGQNNEAPQLHENSFFKLLGDLVTLDYHEVPAYYDAPTLYTQVFAHEVFPETPLATSTYHQLFSDFTGELISYDSFAGGAYVTSQVHSTGPDLTDNNQSSIVSQYRFWLDAGEGCVAITPQTRTFIKVRYEHRGAGAPTLDPTSVESVALTIPAGERFSPAYDLTPAWANSSDPNFVATPNANGDQIPEGYVKFEEKLFYHAIVNSAKRPVAELKVAKMSEPGVLTTNSTGQTVLEIEEDSDRFYFRLAGAANAKLGKCSITLKTDNPDGTYYNNPETTIELHVEGNDLISPSLLLMSDKEDDQHKVDGIDGNANVVPLVTDDSLHDRTFLVQLGGTLKITKLTFVKDGSTITKPLTLEAKVPIKKEIPVRVVVLRDKPAVENGIPVITPEKITADFKIVNERYAQIGIKLTPSIEAPINPPAFPKANPQDPEVLINMLDGPDQSGIKKLGAQYLLKALATPSLTDLEVFYVTDLLTEEDPQENPQGLTHLSGFMGTTLISMDAEDRKFVFVLAHELGHGLSLKHVENDEPQANEHINLLRTEAYEGLLINGLKRLTEFQESKVLNKIKKNGY